MPELSLYNLVHGPEIWLAFAALCGVGMVICIFGLLFSLLRKEDEPDDRS